MQPDHPESLGLSRGKFNKTDKLAAQSDALRNYLNARNEAWRTCDKVIAEPQLAFSLATSNAHRIYDEAASELLLERNRSLDEAERIHAAATAEPCRIASVAVAEASRIYDVAMATIKSAK